MNDQGAVRLSENLAPSEDVPCPLCGSWRIEVLYDHMEWRLHIERARVVQCVDCSLVYLSPRLRDNADNFTFTQAYRDDYYLPYQEGFGLIENGVVDEKRLTDFYQEQLEEAERVRKLNRILDVGCAIGLFVRAAQNAGWDAFGVEVSQALVDYGRTKLGLQSHCGDLRSAGYPDNWFDAVVLWDVIEHLLDPLAELAEIRRVLRPGGRLILQTPNADSIAHELLGDQWDMLVTDHFVYFSISTLTRALRQAGFGIDKVWAFNLGDQIGEVLGQEAARRALASLSDPENGHKFDTLRAVAVKPDHIDSTTWTTRFQTAWSVLRSDGPLALSAKIGRFLYWRYVRRVISTLKVRSS